MSAQLAGASAAAGRLRRGDEEIEEEGEPGGMHLGGEGVVFFHGKTAIAGGVPSSAIKPFGQGKTEVR